MNPQKTLSSPVHSSQQVVSASKSFDEKLRIIITSFFLGGTIGLWFMSFSEWLFPLGLSRLNAFLLCAVYVPAVVIWWRLQKQPAPTAPYSLSHRQSVLLGLAVFAFWGLSYYSVGLLMQANATRTLHTFLDRSTPMLPWTSFIYASVQWFMVAAIITVADYVPWRPMLKAYLSVIVICTLFFAFFPVTMTQPNVPVIDLATWVISLIRTGDVSNNCFPSSHCAMALLSTFFLFKKSKFYGILGLVCTLGIAISTMTTKQHYFADVIGGFVLAIGSYLYWFRLQNPSEKRSSVA